MTVMAKATSSWAAEQVAKDLTPNPQPELSDPAGWGEGGPFVIRVVPKNGEWWVERWEKEALMWEAEDEKDIPF